jgi:hypothetical protein
MSKRIGIAGTVENGVYLLMEPYVRMKNVSKFFHNVVALDDISVDFNLGEIHVVAVKTVSSAGIPVVAMSSDVNGNQGQGWVGSENENGGATEAEYVAKQLNGTGNIAVLRGPLGHFAEQGRFRGKSCQRRNNFPQQYSLRACYP